MPAGDVHGDALDPGAERRLPHARPHDCAHAARFRVHRCPDVQVTTSGSASAGSASAVGNHSTVRRPATAALTVGSLSDVGGWRSPPKTVWDVRLFFLKHNLSAHHRGALPPGHVLRGQ